MLIDHRVLSSIYQAMNSSFFSSVMAVFDKGQPLVYTYNMIFQNIYYVSADSMHHS